MLASSAAAKYLSNPKRGKETEISNCNAAAASSVGIRSENGGSTHFLEVETFNAIEVHFDKVISLSLFLCAH